MTFNEDVFYISTSSQVKGLDQARLEIWFSDWLYEAMFDPIRNVVLLYRKLFLSKSCLFREERVRTDEPNILYSMSNDKLPHSSEMVLRDTVYCRFYSIYNSI
jgi:hypothetical protein